MRVFVGPNEIAGYYRNLTLGLRSIGIDADFITYQSHRFGYGGETHRPFLLGLAQSFDQFRGLPHCPFPVRIFFRVVAKTLQSVWAIYPIFAYDVFIFNFGISLLPMGADLPLLRLLGKTIITGLSHGSEARPVFMDGAFQSNEGVRYSINAVFRRSKHRVKVVNRHFKYGSVVIGSPCSTSQYGRGKFINTFSLGIPFALSDHETCVSNRALKSQNNPDVVRILHSPSHPACKGTSIIENAIKNLKNKGYLIEFVLIHGRPYEEVLAEIQLCDFVVDQVYSDFPLCGFATEAAWFGKPAVVGGYGLQRLKNTVAYAMWPPSQTCHPTEIEKAIEDFIIDKAFREKLGADAQKFVREKWNAVQVAIRFQCLINGQIPNDWWVSPSDFIYLDGCGQSQEMTRQIISDIVLKFGVSSLQFSHRPDLEEAALKFAGFLT